MCRVFSVFWGMSLSSDEEKPPSGRSVSGADPVTLASAAEKPVAEGLGKLAESFSCIFACGGELTSDKIKLIYENRTGELHKGMFPAVSDADIQELLDACSISSFGHNDHLVTVTKYRSSVKLDPDNFMTSFQVANTPIQLAAMTIMQGIQAELYKLNSGGHKWTLRDLSRCLEALCVCQPNSLVEN